MRFKVPTAWLWRLLLSGTWRRVVWFKRLIIEATASSETSVQLYQTTRHHKPGDIAVKKRRIFIAKGLVFCDISLCHLQNVLFERSSSVRADVALRPVKHRRSIWRLTVLDGHLLAPTESCQSCVTQHTYLLSRRNGISERRYVKRLLCCYTRVERTCVAQGLSEKLQTQRWPQSNF